MSDNEQCTDDAADEVENLLASAGNRLIVKYRRGSKYNELLKSKFIFIANLYYDLRSVKILQGFVEGYI